MVFLDLSIFRKAFRFIGAVLCDVIYTLISKVYELFITVARLNILSSSQIQPIYQRITLIFTIVMVFYVTFEFVKYTISPDTFTDKEKGVGNILKRVVIVVISIALVPEAFTLAYKLQNKIIETQLISKIILGTTSSNYTTYGNEFSANTLNLFYYYDTEACSGSNAGAINDCSEAQRVATENINHIKTTGDSDIVSGINLASGKLTSKEVNPAIKFNGVLAIVVGGFILYILVLYSIDVGTRYAQLIFLQVISPIAIMGYILPKKDGIFQKWGKQCITTYIDLFIRIAIINFVLLIIKVLGDAFQSGNIFEGIGDVSTSLKVFAYIVLVMGLLVFAQRAPKLLGELFPSSGAAGLGFGLSGKNRFEPTTKALKGTYKGLSSTANAGARVAGGVGGAIAGFTAGKGFRGKLRTGFAGAREGAKKDNKGLPHRRIERGLEAARQRRNMEDQIVRDSYGQDATISQREKAVHSAMYHKEKYANIASEKDRQLKLFDIPKGSLDSMNAQIDEFKQIKALKQELESAKSRGASAADVKTLDAKYKAACQVIRREVVKNNGNLDNINYPVNITYDVLDNNGFKIGKKTVALQLDEGDKNFAGAIEAISKTEFAKIKSAASDVPEIANANVTLKINGKDITASVSDWINGTVKDPDNPDQMLTFDSRQVYSEFANKFKDAMATPKTEFANDQEFFNAHAYKDGIGDSNGGKK